jgi:hypothetical protein
MASATSNPFPLASESSYSGGDDAAPGTVGSSGDSAAANSAAGASGTSNDGFSLSHGALIAIIVVVVLVAILGSKPSPAGMLLLDTS